MARPLQPSIGADLLPWASVTYLVEGAHRGYCIHLSAAPARLPPTVDPTPPQVYARPKVHVWRGTMIGKINTVLLVAVLCLLVYGFFVRPQPG